MANFGAPQSGFQFGAAAPAANPSLFGNRPATTQAAGLFGSPAPANQSTFGLPASNAPSTGFGFGTPQAAAAAPTPSLFGAPPSNAPNLFGTPASSAQSPGFNFAAAGAPAPSTGLSFGTPNAAAAKPSLFGTPTPAVPNTGMNFGTPATPAAGGFGLGAAPGFPLGGIPASTAGAGFGFGATPASTAAGFGFGAAPASTAAAGFGLGATPTATASTGFSLGAPAPTPATGFSLGTAAAAPAPSFNLGAPASTPASGFSLGAPAPSVFSVGSVASTPASGFSLGAPVASIAGFSSTPATGFSLGAPAGTTAPSTSLSFGLGNTSLAGPSLGLSFGTSTATATPSFGLGGLATSATSQPTFGLGGISAAVTTTPSVGLGGIQTTTPKLGALQTKGKDISPKEQSLPNELMQSVEEFKSHVKQQKSYCSEICRYSIKEFRNVESYIDTANGLITEVEKQLQHNRKIAEKLKYDTARGLQHVEMAQRTFDTPPGLQYDNHAPFQFFVELANNFEKEMQTLRTQIESTDKYLKYIGKPDQLTPQDLALGMRRLHEIFVALAGRLQSVHSQVESQKEHYLNLRKFLLHDDTNVFEKFNKDDQMNVVVATVDYKPPLVVTGPTPFNPLTNPNIAAHSLQASQLAQSPYSGTPGIAMPNITPTFGTPQPGGSSLFGSPANTSFGQSFGANTSNSFQLQKPPVGNKRSK